MKYKLKAFKKTIDVTRIANIHYFEFIKQYHTFEDFHPFNELIYVDSGSINIKAENYVGVLKSGEMIIHQANEKHSLACNEENAPNVIVIGFECICPDLSVFSQKATHLSLPLQKILTEIIKEGRNVFKPPYNVPSIKNMKKKNNYPFGADQMIQLKLETFLIELIRNETPIFEQEKPRKNTDAKSREIYDYITENYNEKINLEELCFIHNTNKTTLCKNFKTEYGCTILEYQNNLRIRKAKNLMREEKYNLTQIASMLGFSSIHYFSRLFKKYENQSPTKYMKSIKSKLDVQ